MKKTVRLATQEETSAGVGMRYNCTVTDEAGHIYIDFNPPMYRMNYKMNVTDEIKPWRIRWSDFSKPVDKRIGLMSEADIKLLDELNRTDEK